MARSGRQIQRSQTKRSVAPSHTPAYEPAPGLAPVIFVLVTIAFFWPHLSGSAFLWEDFREFTYPNWVFAARSVVSGVVPYWNPFTFNGMPFTADLQVGFYYPVNLLMFLTSGGTLGVWMSQFVIIVHYPLAMIGMWLLARALRVGFWGATLAGIAYGLTGMLVVHMIHANVVQHLAWFPLVVHLFHRGLERGSYRDALFAGIVLGVSFLSGHPQSTLYVVLFLFALSMYHLVRRVRGSANSSGTTMQSLLVCSAIPIAVAGGIFAVQLLQAQELAGLSERAEMSYEKTLEGKFAPAQIITLVAPKYFGVSAADPEVSQKNPFWYPPERSYLYWETAVYIGVVVLVLACLGLLSRRLGSFGWFLAAMSLFGLLYAVGDSFLVHPLVGRLPLFSSFRIPTRMAIFLSFGGALLAGAGLDRLVRGEVDRTLAKRSLVAGGVVIAASLLVVSGMANALFNPPEAVSAGRASTGVAGLLLSGATTLIVVLTLRGSLAPLAAGVIALLLAVVDLFGFGAGQNSARENPARDVYDVADATYAQFKAKPPDDIYRVKMREGGAMLMPRNQGPYSGIMLYEGYNPLLLARRVPPTGDLQVRSNLERAFDLLDIRYDVRIDSATGAQNLVERPTRYPHARLLFAARVVPADSARSAMGDAGLDLSSTVVLEEDPGIQLPGNGQGTARITSYDASRIAVKTESDKPSVLLLSEIWYPSWKARVDGADAKLMIGNYSLRAVPVPAGKHTVEMTFESDSASRGLLITLATSLVAVLAAMVLTLRRRTGRTRDGSGSGPNA